MVSGYWVTKEEEDLSIFDGLDWWKVFGLDDKHVETYCEWMEQTSLTMHQYVINTFSLPILIQQIYGNIWTTPIVGMLD